ncbi:hypothetical protein P7K49_031118 [Saguinus oedipus]|uniref:Uncharacterized protein n=1 Tax=Saguinus oedipus TaxID=9490 RepID=A0ABQ9U435_SAGOE|nr:hypothetical protein P7K49_031118 [Saguinus oedipus]
MGNNGNTTGFFFSGSLGHDFRLSLTSDTETNVIACGFWKEIATVLVDHLLERKRGETDTFLLLLLFRSLKQLGELNIFIPVLGQESGDMELIEKESENGGIQADWPIANRSLNVSKAHLPFE